MTQPIATHTYTFSVNNRSTFASLNQVMREYIFGIKNFLVATLGYTVKYSCDGTTGPASGSDHTDRWTTAANAGTRGANVSTAQSWIVLTDGDGVDFMISYTGATDDVGRYAFSQTGVYTPAGTATFPATATDEVVASITGSWIETTTSGDRLFHLMGTSDKKNWRALISRAGIFTGVFLGMETYTSALVAPAVQTINKTAFFQLASNTTTNQLVQSGNFFGFARVSLSSVLTNINWQCGWEGFSGTQTNMDGVNAELQGANGAIARALSMMTTSTNAGKLGQLIDWWHDASAAPAGNTTTDKKMIHITSSTSNLGGLMWPWDGSTTPVLT